jgi:hypoxanthine phosphoribosyltransferase
MSSFDTGAGIRRQDLKILHTEDEIRERIEALGRRITEDYRGRPLAVVGILKGSFIFLADLVRRLELDCTIDFLGLSSYGLQTESSGVVRVTSDLSHPIDGKDVLVVEDIVDTGLTLRYLTDNLRTRMPRSIEVCALLVRAGAEKDTPMGVKYQGFVIHDHYVIGYGLDYSEYHRNLPFVGYKP